MFASPSPSLGNESKKNCSLLLKIAANLELADRVELELRKPGAESAFPNRCAGIHLGVNRH